MCKRFSATLLFSVLSSLLLPLSFFINVSLAESMEPHPGKMIYQSSCMVCHGKGGSGNAGKPLIGIKEIHNLSSIKNQITKGGNTMPALSWLSEDEVSDVADFVLNHLNNQSFSENSNKNKKQPILQPKEISVAPKVKNISAINKPTHSVTEFAYGPLNQGVADSFISVSTVNDLAVENHPHLKNSLKYMPLLSRGKKGERIILYGTNDEALEAYDVDSKKIIWRTELPTKLSDIDIYSHKLISTPVLDHEANKLYAMSLTWRKKQPDERNINIFQIIDAQSGKVETSCPLMDSHYFKENGVNVDDWSKHVHCKTALAYEQDSDGTKRLYAGCSMVIIGGEYHYGNKQGVVGAIAKLESDRNGSFDACKVSIKPMSSTIDTGLYMAGGKITVLPDGDLLVASGNGPVGFNNQDYGCALTRFSSNLSVRSHNDGSVAAYSPYPSGDLECWMANDEYTVGSTSVVDVAGTKIAAGIKKNGTLTFYKPDSFSEAGRDVVDFKMGSAPTYGTPIAYEKNGEAVFIAAIKGEASPIDDRFYSNENYVHQDFDYYLSTNVEFDKNSIQSCYGYVGRDKEKKAIDLYYSGQFKKDYAVTVAGSEVQGQLVSKYSSLFGSAGDYYYTKTLWAPYRYKNTLGYSIDKALAGTIIRDNPQLKLSMTNKMPLYMHGYQRNVDELQVYKDLNFLKLEEGGKRCPDLGKNLVPVYLAKRAIHDNSKLKYDSIVAISVNLDLKMQILWMHSLKASDDFSVVHPILLKSSEEEDGVVMISILNNEKGAIPETVVLDASNGHQLRRIKNSGIAHFSMPLVFDEKVIFPSTNGAEVYSIPNG